jgi:hypothetical protein
MRILIAVIALLALQETVQQIPPSSQAGRRKKEVLLRESNSILNARQIGVPSVANRRPKVEKFAIPGMRSLCHRLFGVYLFPLMQK